MYELSVGVGVICMIWGRLNDLGIFMRFVGKFFAFLHILGLNVGRCPSL